jgi:hypothetical protein
MAYWFKLLIFYFLKKLLLMLSFLFITEEDSGYGDAESTFTPLNNHKCLALCNVKEINEGAREEDIFYREDKSRRMTAEAAYEHGKSVAAKTITGTQGKTYVPSV